MYVRDTFYYTVTYVSRVNLEYFTAIDMVIENAIKSKKKCFERYSIADFKLKEAYFTAFYGHGMSPYAKGPG